MRGRRGSRLRLLALGALLAAACPARNASRPGRVVAYAGPAGAAAQAGLRPGDRLLAWHRAASPPANPAPQEGAVSSCAGLAELEVEQGPRGPIRLEVERGGQRLAVTLPGGDWQLALKPPAAAAPDGAACSEVELALRAHDAKQLAEEAAAWGRAARWGETARRPLFRALALERAGTVEVDRNDFAAALPHLELALRLRREAAPGSLAEAASWHALGRLERTRGDYAKGAEHLRRALALREAAAPDSPERAATLNNLGIVAWISGDLEGAHRHYAEALAVVRRRAAGTLGEAQVLNNLGILEKQQDRLASAETYFQASYRIAIRHDPNGFGPTFCLTNLGGLAYDRGNFALSETYHLATLERYRQAMPDGLEAATALYNLALIAEKRRDTPGAAKLLKESLAIRQRLVPGTPIEADTLSALADNALTAGRLEEARQLGERALALRSKLAPESDSIALSLGTLTQVALQRRDFATAKRLVQAELARRGEHPLSNQRRRNNLMLRAELAAHSGDDAGARRHYLALIALMQTYKPHDVEMADVHRDLGRIERRTGNARRAEAQFRAAIEVLEWQMKSLGGTDEQLVGFEESYLPIYLDLIELQLARGDRAGALETLERSRARGLLSLLAQRDLVFSADLPAPLRERQRRLDHDYAAAQGEIAELDPGRKTEIAARRRALERLAGLRAALSAEIARTSPRYAALQNPRPLDLGGIRRALDPGTVYLAYALGTERSHLFVVGPQGLRVHTLALTREGAAREVGIFRSLLLAGVPEAARRDGKAGGSQGPEAKADAALRAQARRLYDLLVAPAEADLQAAERLLVSPDGALHLLPFAALRRADPGGSQLIEWKPLHTVVSATLYAELKARRKAAGPAPALAAFAAPSYLPKSGKTGPEDSPLRRYRQGLAPLPASLGEARNLAALYGTAARVYTGPAASESQATHLDAGIRIVHFAGHALLDRHFPLDSALALSAARTPSLDGTDDGLLQAWEILERVRLDADLVTLSACETGLGNSGGGEGLIGLTRAFQYAGARSILASLWSVSDRSTAELMRRFYAALKGGLPKDRALQAAQVAMLRAPDPALSHPYHWAAFEMIGDWE